MNRAFRLAAFGAIVMGFAVMFGAALYATSGPPEDIGRFVNGFLLEVLAVASLIVAVHLWAESA